MSITPDQARALLDGATPGPWKKRRDRDGTPIAVVVSAGPTDRHHIMTAEPACSEERAQADTGLIAAAPALAQTIAGMTVEYALETLWGTGHDWAVTTGWFPTPERAWADLALDTGPTRLVRRLVSETEVVEP